MYTNSSLVDCTVKSPNHSGERTHRIERITPHCVVGQLSAETIGACFTSRSVEASCNYGIGFDGRVALIVDEEKRSWCSSSNDNDQKAITIECACDKTHPYAMTDEVYKKLVELCVDICKRNGKTKLIWFGDKEKTLNYKPLPTEMVITVHRWFKNKACPGDWLYSRLGKLAEEVTKQIAPVEEEQTIYRVQVGAYSLKINANNMLNKLKAKGFDGYVKWVKPYYKVQVGAYSVKTNAENMLKRLNAAGFQAFITTNN